MSSTTGRMCITGMKVSSRTMAPLKLLLARKAPQLEEEEHEQGEGDHRERSDGDKAVADEREAPARCVHFAHSDQHLAVQRTLLGPTSATNPSQSLDLALYHLKQCSTFSARRKEVPRSAPDHFSASFPLQLFRAVFLCPQSVAKTTPHPRL